MRKAFIFCLFLFWGAPSVVFLSLANAAAIKPKIAFFTLVPQNIEAIPLIDTIPSLLTVSISKMDSFEILERKKTEKEIELAGYKLGSIKINDLVKLGEKLGFDFCVVGSVSKHRGTINATISVVDIRTPKVCGEHSFSTTEGRLNQELKGVATMIMERTRESQPAEAVKPIPEEITIKPPSDLKVKGGPKTIRISWDYSHPLEVCGFRIYRAKNEEGPFMPIGTVPDMFFVDESPPLNEPAFYRVAAVNAKGLEGTLSIPIKAWTVEGPVPPIFTNVESNVKTAHLKWKIRPGFQVASIKIFRKEETEKEFKEIASLSGKDTSTTDLGLKDHTAYFYALAAIDESGKESDLSKILEVKTPQSPNGLKAEGGKIRRIYLSWIVHPADFIEGYIIYRATDKMVSYKQIAKIKERSIHSYTDKEGLGDSTTYWYKISAFNRGGVETDPSEAETATTRGIPPTPQEFSAKNRECKKASLRWKPVQSLEDEIKEYHIFRATEETGKYKHIARIGDPQAQSFIDTDPSLKDNTTYYYKIVSSNVVGASSELSPPLPVTTKNIPAVTKNIVAQSGEVRQVTLSWEPNPEKDIKEYIVFRAGSGGKDLSKIAVVRGKTNYVNTNLKDGVQYTYYIQGVDEDGLLSDMSPPAIAKTKPLPVKPTGLMLSEKEGRKLLQWEPNPEKDVKQYNLYRKGFMGLSQKIVTVQGNVWNIPEGMKGKIELFISALNESGQESEGSDPVVMVLDKR